MKYVLMVAAFAAMAAFMALIGLSNEPSSSAYGSSDRTAFQQ